MKIAVFYHMLLYYGDPPDLSDNAVEIVAEQMAQLKESGLLDACHEMVVGCNGGPESEALVPLIIPPKATVLYHGLKSRSENLTICALHEWAKENPGWFILYFHAKGCSHTKTDNYAQSVSNPWRRAMMRDLVMNWKPCLQAMSGYQCDIVCSYWLWNMAAGDQHIPAGNFLWTTSDFVARLPSMFERARIKVSGIDSLESRFESEVFWGNGPTPKVVQRGSDKDCLSFFPLLAKRRKKVYHEPWSVTPMEWGPPAKV